MFCFNTTGCLFVVGRRLLRGQYFTSSCMVLALPWSMARLVSACGGTFAFFTAACKITFHTLVLWRRKRGLQDLVDIR